jgi:hypothetical protein
MEPNDWLEARQHSPDQLALARLVLEKVRAGQAVHEALRQHPLPAGEGYLAKHALVAAYR